MSSTTIAAHPAVPVTHANSPIKISPSCYPLLSSDDKLWWRLQTLRIGDIFVQIFESIVTQIEFTVSQILALFMLMVGCHKAIFVGICILTEPKGFDH